MSRAAGPSTGYDSTAKIDSWLAGLPAPSPVSPVPAQETTASAVIIYREIIVRIVKAAARPGVFCGFLVSSLIVSVTSHPQNIKIEREIPAATSEKFPISSGLNHETSDRKRVV